eukprot:250335-Ditylum_brightwellii.AAC.1
MHGVKSDWCNLVPMFSLSYVKRRRDAGVKRSTADSQSIKAICVGNGTQSDGLLFYLPTSKKLIASSDYRLDPSVPSGPVFGLTYNGCIGFDLFFDASVDLHPPIYKPRQQVHYQVDKDSSYAEATVLILPKGSTDDITLQNIATGDVLTISPILVTNLNPATVKEITAEETRDHFVLHIPWVKPNAKVTLYLSSMHKPKRGYLITQDEQWFF